MGTDTTENTNPKKPGKILALQNKGKNNVREWNKGTGRDGYKGFN
jgi:hypothetical protein